MDFNSMLIYQEKDKEFKKLQVEIKKVERDIENQQKKLQEIENLMAKKDFDCNKIVEEYNNLRSHIVKNNEYINKAKDKDFEKMDTDKIDSIESVSRKILNYCQPFEKKLGYLAKIIRETLKDFEQQEKNVKIIESNLEKLDKVLQDTKTRVAPLISRVKEELAILAKDVEPKLLEKYKHARQSSKFPHFVPCVNKTCGGCHMELPSASFSKLKTDGVLECDCHRIIYYVAE